VIRDEETTEFRSSFNSVRILHYAGAKPVQNPWILKRLRSRGGSLDAPALSRILRRLTRNGCLKSDGHSRGRHLSYSLTPKGRHVLALARKRLNNLVRTLRHQ